MRWETGGKLVGARASDLGQGSRERGARDVGTRTLDLGSQEEEQGSRSSDLGQGTSPYRELFLDFLKMPCENIFEV